MSVVKLSEGLYEVRWREEGRQKTKRIHGGYDLARKVLRKNCRRETKTGTSM